MKWETLADETHHYVSLYRVPIIGRDGTVRALRDRRAILEVHRHALGLQCIQHGFAVFRRVRLVEQLVLIVDERHLLVRYEVTDFTGDLYQTRTCIIVQKFM